MDIFNIIAIGIVGSLICILLKQYKPEYATILALCCGVMIFAVIISMLTPIFDNIKTLLSNSGVNLEYSKIIVKSLGICYISQLASDACKDSGQSMIASKIELAGKASILVLCLPLFEKLSNIAISLINI